MDNPITRAHARLLATLPIRTVEARRGKLGSGNLITPSMRRRMVSLKAQGYSARDIADMLNVHESSVHRYT